MPRRRVPPVPKAASTQPLALSELHLRLAALEKEHNTLIKQIKKKQTELDNFVSQLRSLATQMFHRAAPSMEKMAAIDREIHNLFKEIFATRKFGKQTQKNIESVYRNLQLIEVISEPDEDPDEDPELDQLFEDEEGEKEFYDQQQKQGYYYHRDRPENEYEAVGKSESSRKVRQTFLKLAEIFHPDRVTDSETQMRHTEIMKEINKAYQEGDIAKLLEIERKHNLGESIDHNNEDDLARQCNRLEEQNAILKTQSENLKRELRLVKNTPEGALVADARKASKLGIDILAEIDKELEAKVKFASEIRDFIQEFREQKMTIKEFLKGQPVLREMHQKMMEEMLAEMFGSF